MPWQKTEGRILAADKDEEEKELGKLKTHMLNKYSTVFSYTINEKPIAGTPMKIHLRDDIQINPQKCYVARAMPVHQQAAATKLEQELEAAGIIRKVDKPTAWTSPGFFVPKPNGGVRLVTDYAGPRGLNRQILRPMHPVPAAHDIVQAIPPMARYFATADCVHSYFQLALDKESRDLTKFMLPSGRWQYLRGPMGLSATSEDWCRKEGNENARKIVDDILCRGATMQELMIKLDTILLRCKAIGITLSIKKFKISKEVAFSGYVVKQGAIRPSPERAIALKEFPRPENIHELRSFLGLVQQLAGFIPGLSHASEPHYHLLKKEKKWVWSCDLQDAFDTVVKILTCDLVLINFDPSKPTIVLTDASRLKGLGFAFVHTETVDGKERIRLVTCGSRSLKPAEKSYAVVELEALAIKYAVEKCRYGMQKFTVWTDHRPLLGIWRKQIDKIGNARCQKWRENLSIYNFNVEWKAGKTHYVADSLSSVL
jgi:hypothetical protein